MTAVRCRHCDEPVPSQPPSATARCPKCDRLLQGEQPVTVHKVYPVESAAEMRVARRVDDAPKTQPAPVPEVVLQVFAKLRTVEGELHKRQDLIDKGLLAGTAVWCLLLLVAPGLRAVGVGLALSLLLLLVNFAWSVRGLLVHGRLLIALNLAQLALLALANAQLYAIDASHFGLGGKPPYRPGLFDWFVYVGLRTLHVIDLFDELEVLAAVVLPIRHASFLSGTLVALLNLSVLLFLAKVLVAYREQLLEGLAWVSEASREVRALPGVGLKQQTMGWAIMGLLLAPAWYWVATGVPMHPMFWLLVILFLLLTVILFGGPLLGQLVPDGSRRRPPLLAFGVMAALLWVPLFFAIALLQGWKAYNWLLFPLDSAVRVVDFADVMTIAHLRLHTVEMSASVALLAMLTRFVIGCFIAGPLLRWRMGLTPPTPEELVDLLLDPDPATRRQAAKALREHAAADPRLIEHLAETLRDEDDSVRQAAFDALESLGAAAVPALTEEASRRGKKAPALAAELLRRCASSEGPAKP